MATEQWFDQSQYFNTDRADFDSPDVSGSRDQMDTAFLDKLSEARQYADTPFKISSGYRTTYHNLRVGGVNGSSHTKGLAVDIIAYDSKERYRIIRGLLTAGFHRIGVSKNFVHVDDDSESPPNVIWTY